MEFFSILPACAGVILAIYRNDTGFCDSSRMRGGDPKEEQNKKNSNEFFPHARG